MTFSILSWATIAQIQFQNTSFALKDPLNCLKSLLFSTLSSRTSLGYLLSPQICLFCIFSINGIIQYAAFCSWLLSLRNFSKWLLHFTYPTAMYEDCGLQFLHILALSVFFIIAILMGMMWCLIVDLISISLMTNAVE